MTKLVEVYTISKNSEVTPVGADYYRFQEVFIDEDMKVCNKPVKIEGNIVRYYTVPIKRICRKDEFGEVFTRYLVVEPEVEETISLEYRQEIERLGSQLYSEQVEKEHYLNRLTDYNSLPWYKKLFKGNI